MDSTSFLEPLCDIVIPIWDQPERTRRCLESVTACTPRQARLTLVDNGSRPLTRELLVRFARESCLPVKILRNERNLGFIRAANQGIRAATSPWICLLNNDTVVTEGWLEEMIRVAQANPNLGLLNPTSNSLGFDAGPIPLEQFARSLKAQSGQWTELSVALGFCLLARRDLFDRIGPLDESFGMGNFDDDDLSRRARQAGLLCARVCAAYVYHEEKASFRRLPGWEKEFEKNRRRFEQKWGRRLRILWVMPGAPEDGATSIGRVALELVKQGHWICFASPPGRLPEEVVRHAQISQLPVGEGGWRLKVFLRLLTKRKKPFQLVVTYDAAWASRLQRWRWILQTEILVNPSPEQVAGQCQRQSRSP